MNIYHNYTDSTFFVWTLVLDLCVPVTNVW